MKLFRRATDGGPHSHVTGFFLVEIKWLFSIVLLHFRHGTREAFHSHAFNAITWILKGWFHEEQLDGTRRMFVPSFWPKITLRNCFHKVFSYGDTWAISFRGPWKRYWREYLPESKRYVTLTHGRKIVAVEEEP